jgi:hypothetical protein
VNSSRKRTTVHCGISRLDRPCLGGSSLGPILVNVRLLLGARKWKIKRSCRRTISTRGVTSTCSLGQFITTKTEGFEYVVLRGLRTKTSLNLATIDAISVFKPKVVSDLREAYTTDTEFSALFTNSEPPCQIRDECLFKGHALCTPKGTLRDSILHDTHDAVSAGVSSS